MRPDVHQTELLRQETGRLTEALWSGCPWDDPWSVPGINPECLSLGQTQVIIGTNQVFSLFYTVEAQCVSGTAGAEGQQKMFTRLEFITGRNHLKELISRKEISNLLFLAKILLLP